MKTVFKSDEIAHIWAHRGAPYGRSPGNLSFDGDAIKSYSTVIGRRITYKGRVAYVVDCARFSNTTSKSQGRVLRAIPDSEKTFAIRSGCRGQDLRFTPATLAAWFEENAREIGEAMPSRYAHKRAEQWRETTGFLQKAREVLAFFDMGTARLDKKLKDRAGQEASAADLLKAHGAKLTAAKEARERRELKECTERNIKQAQDYIAGKIKPLRYFDLSAYAAALATLPEPLGTQFRNAVEIGNARLLDEWRKGADVALPHDVPTLLRVEGGQDDSGAIIQEMVTSHGARVPLSDARRTYRFAMLARAKGWHRNGEKHAIGSYQLDAVNENGVVAGCHRVSWAEIERFAASQGWQGGAK